MSRRHRAETREVIPDAKFGDIVITKFMNSLMYAGKKSAAETIVYGAFDIIGKKTRQEPVRHGLLAAGAGRLDYPTHRQGLTPVGAYLDRHLIGRAADAAGFDFDHGFDVIQRLLQHGNRFRAGASALLADPIDGAIDDFLGGRLLAALHHHIDEFGQHVVAELRVGKNGAMGGCCSTRH